MSEIKKLEEHVGANAICICDYGQNEYTLSIGAIAEINKAFDALNAKLAQHRQAVEDGLVVELPCPIGSKIFEADRHTGKVYETKAWKEHMLSMIAPMWGKRYFATRAEAEAALLKEGTE